MADLEADYRLILEGELSRKKERNRRLMLSVDLAASFAERLRLSDSARREFILSAADEQRCHALYLVDPSLTECDPGCDQKNLEPRLRTRSK